MIRTLIRSFASSPPPAEGFLAGVGESMFIMHSAEQALQNKELNLKSKDTKKMNTCQAINDAMSIALGTNDKAGSWYALNDSGFWRGCWVWWSFSLHSWASGEVWEG